MGEKRGMGIVTEPCDLIKFTKWALVRLVLHITPQGILLKCDIIITLWIEISNQFFSEKFWSKWLFVNVNKNNFLHWTRRIIILALRKGTTLIFIKCHVFDWNFHDTDKLLDPLVPLPIFLIDTDILYSSVWTNVLPIKLNCSFSNCKCHFVCRIWNLIHQLSFTGCGVQENIMTPTSLQWLTLNFASSWTQSLLSRIKSRMVKKT